MKGAIGNAFILNMVITFIIIFYMLLIGAVAYSKAYKINSYLVNSLVSFDERYGRYDNGAYILDSDDVYSIYDSTVFDVENDKKTGVKNTYVDKVKTWDQAVNDYLARSGYIINGTGAGTCAKVIDDKYQLIRDNKNGYDYCLYINVLYDSKAASIAGKADDPYIDQKYMYKVVSYMKFDFPIVGSFMKLPIKSETKVITRFK